MQLSFVTKIQLHVTHATTNLCSCIRHLVTCDNTYATCIYDVHIHVCTYITNPMLVAPYV